MTRSATLAKIEIFSLPWSLKTRCTIFPFTTSLNFGHFTRTVKISRIFVIKSKYSTFDKTARKKLYYATGFKEKRF